MKRPIHYLFSSLIFGILCAIPLSLFAQKGDGGENVRVRIVKIEDGNRVEIDTLISEENEEKIDRIIEDIEAELEKNMNDLDLDESIEVIVRTNKMDANNHDYHFKIDLSDNQNLPFLGVECDMEGAQEGVTIKRIIEGTEAEDAGLMQGDVILKVDKDVINDCDELVRQIRAHQPGDKVKLTILRDGKEQKVKSKIGSRVQSFMDKPFFDRESWHSQHMDMPKTPFLGVTYDAQDGQIVIERVLPGTTAEAIGIQSGDIIKSLNGQVVNSENALRSAIAQAGIDAPVSVTVIRDGTEQTLSGTMSSRPTRRHHMPHVEIDIDGKSLNNMTDDIEIAVEELDRYLEENDWNTDEYIKELELNLEDMLNEVEDLREKATDMVKEYRVLITVDEIGSKEFDLLQKSNPDLDFENELTMNEFNLSPNPGSGRYDIHFESDNNLVPQVLIYDAGGNLIWNDKPDDFNGSYENQIDISDHARGTYFLIVTQGDEVFSRKIISQ